MENFSSFGIPEWITRRPLPHVRAESPRRDRSKPIPPASLGLKDNQHEGSPAAPTSVAGSQCSHPPYRLHITFLYIKATYPIPLIVQELQTPYCPYNIEQAAKTSEKREQKEHLIKHRPRTQIPVCL